ncbi:uncharacterized protein LOC143847566 isoform X3 [Tasmannia lanceolata]|uniref:uncharacterized protein LOC143847566 isoform X3 n=1 Tax=Tasmannia lanceolata TaxID=3420 RepID=UPI0040628C27
MLDMFDFRDNIWLAFATLPYHFLLVIPSCFRHRTTMVRARIKLLDKIVRKRREGAFDGKDHGCQQGASNPSIPARIWVYQARQATYIVGSSSWYFEPDCFS